MNMSTIVDFKDLLIKQRFDLDTLMVMRHSPTEPDAEGSAVACGGQANTGFSTPTNNVKVLEPKKHL